MMRALVLGVLVACLSAGCGPEVDAGGAVCPEALGEDRVRIETWIVHGCAPGTLADGCTSCAIDAEYVEGAVATFTFPFDCAELEVCARAGGAL